MCPSTSNVSKVIPSNVLSAFQNNALEVKWKTRDKVEYSENERKKEMLIISLSLSKRQKGLASIFNLNHEVTNLSYFSLIYLIGEM